jgi:hypothetical protein
VRKPVWRIALALVGGAALVTPLLASAPACFPQGACDETPGGLYCKLGGDTCPGRRIDDRHWQSNDLQGKWLLFPKNSSMELDPRDPNGTRVKGTITEHFAWISLCETPSTVGCNYVLASGNNAEWYATAWGTLYLKNDTCQDYYVRVVIESDGVEPGDAGSSQDGTAADAAVE